MSDKHDEQVPGITFFFAGSELRQSHGREKFLVNLSLVCEVHDEKLWETVEWKFRALEGFRVFSEEDFHVAVMDVLRGNIQTLEREKLELTRQLQQARDKCLQAEEELQRYKEPFVGLGRALRGG